MSLAADYRAGLTQRQIAERLGVSQATVFNRMRARGIEARQPGSRKGTKQTRTASGKYHRDLVNLKRHEEAFEWWILRKPKIVAMVQRGESLSAIAREIGRNRRHVAKWAQRIGIERKWTV